MCFAMYASILPLKTTCELNTLVLARCKLEVRLLPFPESIIGTSTLSTSTGGRSILRSMPSSFSAVKLPFSGFLSRIINPL